MGSSQSKSEEESPSNVPAEDNKPTTPILAPRIKSLRELDPRSPSSNIVRTPIETVLLRNKNLLKASIEGVEGTPKLKHLIDDPRSPTGDFNRTPIIVNVTKQFNQVETVLDSPVNHKINQLQDRRKSCVLLETNIDYLETDIDDACIKANSFRQESITEQEDVDRIDIGIKKDVIDEDGLQLDISKIKIANIPIENGERIQEEIATENIIETNEIKEEKQIEENEIEEENEIKQEKEIKEDEETPGDKHLKQDEVKEALKIVNNVKDFDKKLSNLIYEEECDKPETPKTSSGTSRNKNRTPLATRNNIGNLRRIPKLKVADKPRTLYKESSKIPISKNKTRRIKVQCENTPPRSVNGGRNRSQEWDGDKTMII